MSKKSNDDNLEGIACPCCKEQGHFVPKEVFAGKPNQFLCTNCNRVICFETDKHGKILSSQILCYLMGSDGLDKWARFHKDN